MYNIILNETTLLKIQSLIEEADERYTDGLYVDAKFDPGALEKIWRLFKKVGFKQLLPINKAHCTIIYSRRQPNKPFRLTPINGYGEPSHFEILGGHKGNPWALVLVLKSTELQRKHKEYMKEYQLRYDYKEYKPHITLVYDIKRFLPGIKLTNPKSRQSVENMFNLLIKDTPKQIRILKQSVSELTKNWQ